MVSTDPPSPAEHPQPSGRFAQLISVHADDECCMFTTIGRRSARPHRIEIWFGVLGRSLYLISGNGPTADWFQNALADPTVSIEFGHEMVSATATEVTDPALRRRVGEMMGTKYTWDGDPSIGLTREAWCFEVPVLAISG